MKIIIDGYPSRLEFEIADTKLPRFRYPCPVRRVILGDALERAGPLPLNHDIEHYMVERVRKTPDGETWTVGS